MAARSGSLESIFFDSLLYGKELQEIKVRPLSRYSFTVSPASMSEYLGSLCAWYACCSFFSLLSALPAER